MSIFNFNDFRPWIRDYLAHQPKKGRGQLAKLAAHLRVQTTLISQIMNEERNMSLEQAVEAAEFFGLSELESQYFFWLVQKDRAGSAKLKTQSEKQLFKIKDEALKLSARVKHERKLTDTDRNIFYSSWLYAAIHIFCAQEKNGKSLDEVCERFHITRSRANEILQFLLQTNMCDEKSGRFTIGTQSTFVEQGSIFFMKHHANWRMQSIMKSESIGKDELMFTAPLALDEKDFQIVREHLANAIKEISDQVSRSGSEQMACLNIDFFKI